MKPDVKIIAEAGCNHLGDMDIACQLILYAKRCGADAIKFQTYRTDQLVNPGLIESFCRQCELDYQKHVQLMRVADECGIKFMSSAFDIDSLEMLHALGLKTVKIPSGQMFNHRLLRRAAMLGFEVYMSTGMASLSDVAKSVNVLLQTSLPFEKLTLFQCTTSYPCKPEDVNLCVLEDYRETFGCKLGFSDHTRGCTAAIGAVCFGATVIEKHFAVVREKTPDSEVSMQPLEFEHYVRGIRDVCKAMGSCIKKPLACEAAMEHRKDIQK